MVKAVYMFCLSALLTLLSLPCFASSRSSELLGGVERYVASLGGYRVDFLVDIQGSQIEGYYEVRGESYFLKVGAAEVYCDGKVRYEVDPEKREVIIDNVDPSSRNILANPTKAFRLLDSGYTHQLLSEQQGSATVRLEPATKSQGVIDLKIRTSDMQPLSLNYNADSQQVSIRVNSIASSSTPLKSFSSKLYPSYELIDFR